MNRFTIISMLLVKASLPRRRRVSVSVVALSAVALSVCLSGCGDNSKVGVAKGIFANLGEPLPSASPAQKILFESGLAVATRRFSPADGLGDHFNVTFCVACHEKPVLGGGGGRYRNFLLVGQKLSDGSFTPTGVNGVQPQFSVTHGRVLTDPETNVFATRNPIPFFGVGLLAEISEEEILSRQDEDDADGDGISGRANFDRGFVGRFGRKAQSVAIESFIRGPLFNHLGITSNPLSAERRALLPVASAGDGGAAARINSESRTSVGTLVLPQVGAPDEPLKDNDGVADPELSEDDLFEVVSFSMLTAAPKPDTPTPASLAGKRLFHQVDCDGCHVNALRGPRGLIPAYTDLLLHDMGAELDDGISMGLATPREFRTAPLWGIGAVAPYLHDGRADTLDQAIRFHGGESEASRDRYLELSPQEQELLIGFLNSLGGSSQKSDGLLPPDAPLKAVGDFGGPSEELSSTDLELFTRGRAVFDLDFSVIGGGLGPFFNGDACRACHFDPVIGGSGPQDVDVIRHGFFDPATGEFTTPAIGTMAHRHASDRDLRPPVGPEANLFVKMQTPSLFGLGLAEQIPRATILSHADPTDSDGDGISGRAHILEGNRLGRLGWRAQVPSVAEFGRDALGAEMGFTVPPQAGMTFGLTSDTDEVADPEVSLADLEALVFFMERLAPPPQLDIGAEAITQGEAAFAAALCDRCHTPTMKTADGRDVHLFSDMLLHDVAIPGTPGTREGDAAPNEFRTPLLWGLRATAPYLHNGSAATVDDAIIAHNGEALASRDAYLGLTAVAKHALLLYLRSI